MTLMSDIRAQMARESGPVRPQQVAEALDQELVTVRNAMNQAHAKGAGIERYEDGTFSLIPGWKPSRGPNAGEQPAATVKAKRAKAKPAKSSRQKRTPAKRPPTKRRKAEPLGVAKALATTPPRMVQIHRSTLAVLVDTVYAGPAVIDGDLRSALRDAATVMIPA